MENFEAKLREYADLLVEVGMNVQPGQIARIAATVECAPLARLCAEAAFRVGAKDVMIDWSDDTVSRLRYLQADEAVFSQFPPYMQAQYDYVVEQNCPILSIIGSDPELLKGVDSARIQAWQRTRGEALKAYYEAMDAGAFQWSIGAYATEIWAEKVFPHKRGQEAVDALWDAIFATCRISGDGQAVARWKEHVTSVQRRCSILNGYNFKSLRYSASNGTDLHIVLPENHIWAGGSELCADGTAFVANIPTEEIFTAPLKTGVNGRVYASLPLALDGNLVTDFYMDFKDGKIVDIHAKQGEEYLRASITIDEGSSYLGEVALVPYDSPINNTGILFYNTLFDENASCHFAFGSSYANTIKGGEKMDSKTLESLGMNQSINHVDFMVGTKDLSIVGTTHDGEEVPVFVNGNFAF